MWQEELSGGKKNDFPKKVVKHKGFGDAGFAETKTEIGGRQWLSISAFSCQGKNNKKFSRATSRAKRSILLLIRPKLSMRHTSPIESLALIN